MKGLGRVRGGLSGLVELKVGQGGSGVWRNQCARVVLGMVIYALYIGFIKGFTIGLMGLSEYCVNGVSVEFGAKCRVWGEVWSLLLSWVIKYL